MLTTFLNFNFPHRLQNPPRFLTFLRGFTNILIAPSCVNFSPISCCKPSRKKTNSWTPLVAWLKVQSFFKTSARKEFHRKKPRKLWQLRVPRWNRWTETKRRFSPKKLFTSIRFAGIFWKSVECEEMFWYEIKLKKSSELKLLR